MRNIDFWKKTVLSLPVVTPLLWKRHFDNIRGLQQHGAAGSENICVGCSGFCALTWVQGAWRGCSRSGFPPQNEAVTAEASLSHKATEQRRGGHWAGDRCFWGSQPLTGLLLCFLLHLALIYLIYPADPLLFCGFMSIFCAWSTFSSQLKLLEQLDYKPGEDCQKEWWGWRVPTLSASSARRAISWPLLATGEFFCSVA